VHILEIEQLWDIGMDKDLMAPLGSGSTEAKSLDQGHEFIELEVPGACKRSLEELQLFHGTASTGSSA
jgi:hypothetical protein